jgi:hypothetical protein
MMLPLFGVLLPPGATHFKHSCATIATIAVSISVEVEPVRLILSVAESFSTDATAGVSF